MAADRSARDAVAFHLAFGVLAGAVLAMPAVPVPSWGAVGPDLGWRLLALVGVYAVALPVVARARGHREWLRWWAFLVPLSVFQVVPDAVLASVLGVLDFPDTGGPRLGPLPLAMAGMWTIPLWITLAVADRQSGGRLGRGAAWAALAAGLMFIGAEATLWAVPIWRAVGVTTVGPVAVYVVPPEILLGAVTWVAYRLTRGRSRALQVAAAALVSLVYLGALVASYALVERAL